MTEKPENEAKKAKLEGGLREIEDVIKDIEEDIVVCSDELRNAFYEGEHERFLMQVGAVKELAYQLRKLYTRRNALKRRGK